MVGSLLLTAALAAAPADPADPANASRAETAHCVAVMQTRADELARQVKAGDKSQESALRSELQRAAALIGRTYLDGLRDEGEAKARLKAARQEQSTWPEARRERLHRDCVLKADALIGKASSVERYVIERVAQRRMNKMLAAP